MNQNIHNQPGVFVPVQVLGHPALNPAIVSTWMMLKLLAGEREESPPVSVQELVVQVGKSSSTLYEHLAALRRAGLIRWEFEARGKMIFSFPDESCSGNLDCSENLDRKTGTHSRKLDDGPSTSPENRNKEIADSRNLDCSENLDRNNGTHSRNLEKGPTPTPENRNKELVDSRKLDCSENLERENGNHSRNLEKIPTPSPENWNDALSLNPLINTHNINKEEGLREARFQKTGQDSENLEKEAVRAYRQTIGLRPNQIQRAAIGEQVRDLARWQATLEHWQMHRWNPKNIPGILELYARDGPQGCRFCRQKKPETGLAALESLRREYASSEYG